MREPEWLGSAAALRHVLGQDMMFGLHAPRYGHDGGCQSMGECYMMRLRSPVHACAYAQFMRREVAEARLRYPSLFPCSWCGMLTGDWCESCPRSVGPACAICSYCEKTIRECRLCRLERYVQLPGRSVRPVPDSAWQSPQGAMHCCAACDVRSRPMQLCAGCRCIRYCSRGCQRIDWSLHRELCAFLQEPRPLFFVYPWHVERAAALRRPCPHAFYGWLVMLWD